MKPVQIWEGEWTAWRNYERWVCCDCLLTHDVERKKRKGKLVARMFRDNRATANRRRAAGVKIMVKRKK